MSLPADFDIRFTEMGDLASLQEWLSVPGACDDFPFGDEEKEEALKNWVGFSKYKASLTGTMKGVPCAIGTLFLMPYKKVAHHAGFYMIVEEKERRKGIGTSMVKNLIHLAKTRFKLESLHVEVFEPSSLRPMLKKWGLKCSRAKDNFVHLGAAHRPRILMEHYFS